MNCRISRFARAFTIVLFVGAVLGQDRSAGASPPTPISDSTGIDKARFISFTVPSGDALALRVKLDSLHHVDPPYTGGDPSAPFTLCEGKVRWVGPPSVYLDSSGDPDRFVASKLQSTPYYRDWSGFLSCTDNAEPFEYNSSQIPFHLCEADADCVVGTCSGAATRECYTDDDCSGSQTCVNIVQAGETCTVPVGPLLHVTGSSIVSSSIYTVESLDAACQGIEGDAQCQSGGANVSTGLAIPTGRWGDIVAPFQLTCPEINSADCNATTCSAILCTTQSNAQDYASQIDRFRSWSGAPIKARALLASTGSDGEIDIEYDLGFDDISGGVNAFRGKAYPYTPECMTNP